MTGVTLYVVKTDDGPLLTYEYEDGDDVVYTGTCKKTAEAMLSRLQEEYDEEQAGIMSDEDLRANEGDRLYDSWKEDL